MKSVVIFAALVCTSLYFCRAAEPHEVCQETEGKPVEIHVLGVKGEKGDTGPKGDNGTPCTCSLQDPNKPSAHIEAENRKEVTYRHDAVIKDWSASAPYSHLAGGMTYFDGKLTVPTPGRYYIYAQIYYHNNKRVFVRVNDIAITMIQAPIAREDNGALYTGGVFKLKAGDVITLAAHGFAAKSNVKIYMYSVHTYFGAFMI